MQFSIFQRGSAREALVFVARTLVARIDLGTCIIDHEGYQCFCVRHGDGLCGVMVCDKEYPARVGFSLLRTLMERFLRVRA